MKYRYSRFVEDLLGEIDLESLVSQLSDLLLSSGFNNPWDPQSDDDRTMQGLHDAILDALLNGGVMSEEMLRKLLTESEEPGRDGEAENERRRDQLEALVQQIIERLTEQGYVSMAGQPDAQKLDGPGGTNGPQGTTRFEVTDKAIDFLGYRALRDLLGSMGRSSVGRHDTRELATGVDAGGPPRPYEFGDTLNLDASATVLNAVKRAMAAGAPLRLGSGAGLVVEHEDLMITQGDYQSSCATVILLDCSHSMVLYGEDRFTPAKRVALALSNLIRHQFPGDALNVVLFHDSAEEVPLSQLGRVHVGPYYTNTREGLRLARRVLERQRKDMKQIIMITDGKPSAVTRPDGRIYRNAFGLDPFVLRETFAEVAACRRAGIMINTFMLARDYDLVAFVRRVARICRGKAYFTTPYTLGQYVESSMNTLPRSLDISQSSHSTAFEQTLSPEVLRQSVPAAFAPSAHERLSASYGFVPTAQVLDALRQAGFRPVEARQTRSRIASALHARHLIRLRRRVEVIGVGDATPELLLLNSHDGTSGVQLRAGLFRAVCSNGLVASVGTFPVWRALHRGHVLEDVVRAALEMSERFGVLATAVERMERTDLDVPQRLEFAAEALALRFPEDRGGAMRPSELLVPQRPEDVGNDLWRVYNVIQGRLLRGGLLRRSATNRVTRTRKITSIREDLRLNSALWDLAMARAA